MILVDTSIWIDHLRSADPTLKLLLGHQRVLVHPLVLGEIAMGSLRQRSVILESLSELPPATVADDDEVLGFLDRYKIYGRGIGFVDAHLLASAKLASARFWTRDKRLMSIAWALSLAADLS